MIVSFCNCQETYPKVIVNDKDTVIAVTYEQAKKVNVAYIDLSECKELIEVYQSQAVKDSILIEKLREFAIISQSQISTQNKAIENYAKMNNELKKSLSISEKQKKRNSIILGSAGGVLVGAIIAILIVK